MTNLSKDYLEWAGAKISALAETNANLLEALETAYHLRFVDDTNTHEEKMGFWSGVEKLIEKANAS